MRGATDVRRVTPGCARDRHAPLTAVAAAFLLVLLAGSAWAAYRVFAGGGTGFGAALAGADAWPEVTRRAREFAATRFDVRSAPPEVLDWLASWLGLVLDDAVSAERKRLLSRWEGLGPSDRADAHAIALCAVVYATGEALALL